MAFWEVLLNFVGSYPLIVIVLLNIIGSEATIFVTFFAGANPGIISFWLIFCTSIVSVLIMDSIYYKIGKTDFIKNIVPKSLKKKKYEDFFEDLKKTTHNNFFIILIISKFIYGFRHFMNIYSGYHKVPYKEYIKRDFVALIIFFGTMLPLAWFAGQGVGIGLESVKKIEIMIGFGLLFVFVVYIIGKIALKEMIKRFN